MAVIIFLHSINQVYIILLLGNRSGGYSLSFGLFHDIPRCIRIDWGKYKAAVFVIYQGGRTFSFSAIVVVGNEEGIIGWGLGKAGEVTAAIAKGVESAKKNLVKVPVLKGTVPHEQSARFGGAEVFIKPASHGTGVVAGGAMRAVLESVGVTDVLAKSKGSSNPHNLVKATIEALSEMRDARMVAQNRGISVEKVFRG